MQNLLRYLLFSSSKLDERLRFEGHLIRRGGSKCDNLLYIKETTIISMLLISKKIPEYGQILLCICFIVYIKNILYLPLKPFIIPSKVNCYFAKFPVFVTDWRWIFQNDLYPEAVITNICIWHTISGFRSFFYSSNVLFLWIKVFVTDWRWKIHDIHELYSEFLPKQYLASFKKK